MIHLIEPNHYAARRLCLTPKNDGQQNTPAESAPLHLRDFRMQTCQECLLLWQSPEIIETGESLLIGTGESV